MLSLLFLLLTVKIMQKLTTSLLFSLGLIISPFALANDTAQLEEGKMLFSSTAQPIACAVCHTLEDAGAVGTIGPNLDELKPDGDRILKTMMEGMGAMPSFADSLDDDQREAIIKYVLKSTE